MLDYKKLLPLSLMMLLHSSYGLEGIKALPMIFGHSTCFLICTTKNNHYDQKKAITALPMEINQVETHPN